MIGMKIYHTNKNFAQWIEKQIYRTLNQTKTSHNESNEKIYRTSNQMKTSHEWKIDRTINQMYISNHELNDLMHYILFTYVANNSASICLASR